MNFNQNSLLSEEHNRQNDIKQKNDPNITILKVFLLVLGRKVGIIRTYKD